MRIIEAQWQRTAQLPFVQKLPPQMQKLLRTMFYTGAAAMFSTMVERSDRVRIADISAELTAFQTEIDAMLAEMNVNG